MARAATLRIEGSAASTANLWGIITRLGIGVGQTPEG